MKKSSTLAKIITEVNTEFGAPMGRNNINIVTKEKAGKLFDCKVPMDNTNAYDIGGAYWGIGETLRVKYNKALTYIEFYRGTKK